MAELKYKVGDRVKIKSLDWHNENKDEDGIVKLSTHVFVPEMSEHCGTIVTIEDVFEDFDGNVSYYMKEIDWEWTDEMIECKVEEETKPKFKVGDKVILTDGNIMTIDQIDDISKWYRMKEDPWNHYTDEMIEGLVESIKDRMKELRKMCTISLNDSNYTDKVEVLLNDYEYTEEGGKSYFVKKKKGYPKTYEECIGKLPINWDGYVEGYKCDLLTTFQKLFICRDAYWKIAGEEMGLGKPWEPDWKDGTTHKFTIHTIKDKIYRGVSLVKNYTFAFPTEEMRDAFKENFDPDIEFCKELL